jgi:hypothetical protein
MVLMCKETGKWTQRLYQLATATGPEGEEGYGRKTRVLVEGPYGGFFFVRCVFSGEGLKDSR